MGTQGTGNFTDVKGQNKPNQSSGSTGGGGGGASGEDRCALSIASVRLEEVERCDYYIQNNTTPPDGTGITLKAGKRIAAETSTGEVIGYLPGSYSYLAGCMEDGYKYTGKVLSSVLAPTIFVHVSIEKE